MQAGRATGQVSYVKAPLPQPTSLMSTQFTLAPTQYTRTSAPGCSLELQGLNPNPGYTRATVECQFNDLVAHVLIQSIGFAACERNDYPRLYARECWR